MAERDDAPRVKKVVIRRVTREQPNAQKPAPEQTRTLTRPRIPRRDREERYPRPPRVPFRQRGAAIARRGMAGTRLGLDLLIGEIRALRWPAWPPDVTAAVTGAAAGLLLAVLGTVTTWGVSGVRGVAGGAGGTGLLLVVLLLILVVVVSALFLRSVGFRRPWTVPALGMIAVLTLVLAFFLGPVGSAWALLLLPLLGAGCFAAADRVLSLAADAPGDDAE
ncbi:hypothetical protein BHE97_08550 [Aeromicrobium sp. PE09-221]|uniref:hypothetical protein n=1 Tax=Aeromicrobium sp. PE09-221 TaxID=1898043 RepID=UPI000B3EAF9C|nr:hypothetical protein [Aeromicrobium sp. PE09-221]OUZ10101.1 hypothetical protein BHE97_08550 [Aeromicrobium sp. PE09-221]